MIFPKQSTLLVLVLAACACAAQKTAAGSKIITPVPPSFQIVFHREEAIPGLEASPVIFPPFQCTSDGTALIDMGRPPDFLTRILTSVSRSREAHVFRPEQVPDLYDMQVLSHFATDSNVVFLVEAADEQKQGSVTMVLKNGQRIDQPRNAAEKHLYILLFDREGKYKRKITIEDGFSIQQVGLFQSGTILAWGYDRSSHAPMLALLNEDGVILKYLHVADGDAPESALRTRDGSANGAAIYLAASQLVPHGPSIFVVQSNSKYPLLEVNEAGGIRAIRPKLGAGESISMIIPSDEGLYATGSSPGDGNGVTNETIYSLDSQDGSVKARYDSLDSAGIAAVACVHDKKFLSFEHGEGKLIPLTGTPERLPDTPPLK